MRELIEGQCDRRIYGNRGYRHQCEKKSVVTRNGVGYCKVHDPEYIKVKSEAREKVWNEKFKRSNEREARRVIIDSKFANISDEELISRNKEGKCICCGKGL
jgi:hypothetical protein